MRIAAILLGLFAIGGDWHQFHGSQRDGSTKEILAPWKEATVVWKQDVGPAHSSPVLLNGVVYLFYQTAGPDKSTDHETLAAFDAMTGQKKWEKSQPRPTYTPQFGLGPRSTPCLNSQSVFTLGNTGILTCWNIENGEVRWKVDTLKEFNCKNLFFGVSTSPQIIGRNVVIMVGGKDAGIVGFDMDTGKTAWKTSSDPASYASAAYIHNRDNPTLIFLTGSHVRALRGQTGEHLWQHPFKDELNESSTNPVVVGDHVIASSVTAGSVALRIAENKPQVVWENKELTCYFSTPMPVSKHIYMVNGTVLGKSVTLRCVDVNNGKVAWEQKNVGRYHAALVRTGDDKLLMLDDRGHLLLLDPDPAGYKELAKSKVCGETWASPALVDGLVYLRDNKSLYCIRLK